MDSCGPDSCPEYKKCRSVNGFEFECIFECEGNACCEKGPNPLCCLNGGVCNSNQCDCICNGNFTGNFRKRFDTFFDHINI